MNGIRAIEIPELAQMVAKHFSCRDRHACALVSKAWQTTFQPHVWSTFTFSVVPEYDTLHSPACNRRQFVPPCGQCAWRQAVDKNSRFILHLNVHILSLWNDKHNQELFQHLCQSCTWLTKLTFRYRSSLCFWNCEYHVAPEMLKGLMERNPGLRSLSTDSKTCLEQAMQTLPNQLTTLKVRISLPITDALHILTAFPRLKTLYLSDNTRSSRSLMRESQEGLVGDATAVRGLPLPLRFLKVTTLSGAAQLSEILEQSPDLQHLHVQESEWIDEATLGMLRSGYFVRLTSLVLGHYAGSAIELVKAIPPHQLRDISIIDPHEPCMLQAVAEHQGQRLEHLELSFRYERVHGLMGLLAQCPALRSLRVNGNAGCLVNTQCLLKQPWACVLLEDLKIPLALPRWAETLAKQGPEVNPTDVMPEVPEWQQAEMHLMKQLGALTRLRRLDATTDLTFDTDETMDLTWCLNAGLGFLAKLEKLEVLDVSGQQYVQGITELQWMKKYLKKLSKLVVRMIGVQEKNWLCNHWPDLKVRDLDINPFEDY